MTLHLFTVRRAVVGRKPRFIHQLFAALAGLALAVTPALAQEAPAKKADLAAKYIPADAHFVISGNIGQLLKKSGTENLKDLPGMDDLIAEVKRESPLAAKFLEDPKRLGIDFDQPIHIFAKLIPPEDQFGSPSGWGGVIAKSLGAKKIEAALRDWAKIAKEEGDEIFPELVETMRMEKGYHILGGKGVPGAMAFNDQVVVAIGADPDKFEDATKLLWQSLTPKKTLAAADPSFAGYLAKPVDLGGWMNLTDLMALSPGITKEQLAEMKKEILGNMRMSGSVHFTPGAISVDFIQITDAPWVKMMKPAPKKELVDLIPQKSVGGLAVAFDMAGTRKFLKEKYIPWLKKMEGGGQALAFVEIALVGSVGLNFNDLLDIPKGEFMFMLQDVKKEIDPDVGFPQPAPKLLFGMTVNDAKKLDKLIQKVVEGGGLDKLGEVGFGVLKLKDRFFLGNTELLNAARLGRIVGAVEGPRRKLLMENETAMFVDFGQIVRLTRDFDGDDEVINVLQKFDQLHWTSNQKKETTVSNLKLLFSDKKKNGLQQLVELIRHLNEVALPGGAERAVEVKRIEVKP